MTVAERVTSIFALFQGSGLEFKIFQTQAVGVEIFSACGKKASFTVPLDSTPTQVDEAMGRALGRLARERQAASLQPKGST